MYLNANLAFTKTVFLNLLVIVVGSKTDLTKGRASECACDKSSVDCANFGLALGEFAVSRDRW